MGSTEQGTKGFAVASFFAIAFAVLMLALPAETSAQTRKAKSVKKPAAAKRIVVKDAFPRTRFDPRRDPFADLAAAKIQATRDNKRIILDIGGEWCGWCIYMDRFFYERPEIDRIRARHYVWVKVNMSPENENRPFLSQYPEIVGYPHLFVLDADGTLLHSQRTNAFENRDGYIPEIVTQFLNDWAPLLN